MRIPELTIGTLTARIPIVQGGMGVRVSRASLAAAVANQGGIGTISSIGLGDLEASKRHFEEECREALVTEIRKAKSMTDGHLAVNVMGVLSNADDVVRTSAREGIKMIVYGAGLPTKMPSLVEDPSVNLVPIVSSARVADLIMRSWDRRHGRTVDAFILEGPLAGGHLGFSAEQLADLDEYSLERLLPAVLASVKPFEQKYQKKIPIIVAGGIYTGGDIARMLSLGAAGVQLGTRFVCTHECGVAEEFKQAYIDAQEEDIAIIKSPVGMPARALRNKFLARLDSDEKIKVKCPYRCLTACQADKARYCIAKVLLDSFFGDVDEGIIFCGQNAYRVDRIVSVKELMDELVAGIELAQVENPVHPDNPASLPCVAGPGG